MKKLTDDHTYMHSSIIRRFFIKIWCTFVYSLRLDRFNSQPNTLKIINNKYKLVKTIKKINQPNKYFSGIYQYKQKKYFIKSWFGKVKNFDYFDLLNEYVNSKKLENIKNDNIKIFFPKVVGLYFSKNQISYIREYVKGKTLSNYSKNKIKSVFETVIEELKKIKPDDNFHIFGNFQYIEEIIYFFVECIIKYPNKFIKIAKLFYGAILDLIFNPIKIECLVDTDLNAENIILNKNKIYIIDVGTLVYSNSSLNQDIVYYQKPQYRYYFDLKNLATRS